jgi:hypothetical protein
VGIDRLDDSDLPDGGRDRAQAEAVGSADVEDSRGRAAAEVRDLETYRADLRTAVAAADGDTEQAGAHSDLEARSELPAWRGDGNRDLDGTANAAVDRGCERIQAIEEDILSPAMRRMEAEDPTRDLAGFGQRLKGADRIKEKVAANMLEKGDTPEQALAGIPDAVRYTFRYGDDRYAAGVQADTERLQAAGFELVKVRNSWTSDQYRGINSQWREPETGQRFEVQFHTYASFDAKQHTHPAYERLRSLELADDEARDLRRSQRRICERVPIPPGAAEIPDFRQET